MNLTKCLKLLSLVVGLALMSCAGKSIESVSKSPLQEYASSVVEQAQEMIDGSPNNIVLRRNVITLCKHCLDSLDKVTGDSVTILDKEKGELYQMMSNAYLDINPNQHEIDNRNNAAKISASIVLFLVVILAFFFVSNRRGEEEEETKPEEIKKKQIPFGKQAEIYDKIIRVMEEEKVYQDPRLSRDKLATLVSTNRTYIAKAVEEMSGLTFSDWLANFRNDIIIKELNENPEISTTELCIAAGFSSPDYLRRQFKNLNGISFSEFKNSIKAVLHTRSVSNSD
ncbi:MAG: AraC family transcriptional regulator [Bacteroidales bacterium]|nr:AraC family transcriptional regulator [Bacteroidales bacterium]